MRTSVMQEMTTEELDSYAAVLGINLEAAKTKAQKIQTIVQARERTAQVSVYGTKFTIAIKTLHDKRVTDKVTNAKSDADYEECGKLILGDKQYGKLVALCTDDDGAIDTDALGTALVRIFSADELKNF